MAEIDTAAPFASVRDAVSMFGERSPFKTQRIFPTSNILQTEKIHSLEIELQQTRAELFETRKQLATAENAAADALKELAESRYLMEESTRMAEHTFATESSSWKSQLDAALEQESRRESEIECGRQEISNLRNELEDFKVQHKTALTALKSAQEENDTLRADILHDTSVLAEKHERNAKEQADIAANRVNDLLEDLFATKDLLAKADVARERAEKELQKSREADSERIKCAANTAAVEVEKLRNELKDAEEKQEQIISAVEKLKDELTATKEAGKKAAGAEKEANLNLQRMKIEVEDAKIAKDKARIKTIQLEESNAKLKKAAEEEEKLLASLASLKAELKNKTNELDILNKEAEDASAEMEAQLSQLQAELDAAGGGEAKAKESLANLSESLQKVSAEAVEAKAAAIQATEVAAQKTQELAQAISHSITLECRLQAALKEAEAARASETFALTEVKFLKKRVSSSTDARRQGQEVIISYDEYESMAKKVIESEDLANKRVAAALAQIDAAKASELEISSELEAAKHLIETSQETMKQAVQVAQAAEAAKSAVEGELRKWRSDNEQRRRAAVAAVMTVGSNGVVQNGKPVATADGLFLRKESMNDLNEGFHDDSPHAPHPRESLAQVLQYNFPSDEKAKKNLFSTKLGSYFGKKVK